jgi:hypothetical protein
MANSKRKPKDTDCKNWFDRKQSNKIARQFAKKLIDGQQDIDPEINAIVRKHFWEML